MTTLFMLIIVGSLLSVGISSVGIPGGWCPAEPSDPNVVRAANFAVQEEYSNVHSCSYRILCASKQVVAGMNYDIRVTVTSDQGCNVEEYRVYDRFGALQLTASRTLATTCTGVSQVTCPIPPPDYEDTDQVAFRERPNRSLRGSHGA